MGTHFPLFLKGFHICLPFFKGFKMNPLGREWTMFTVGLKENMGSFMVALGTQVFRVFMFVRKQYRKSMFFYLPLLSLFQGNLKHFLQVIMQGNAWESVGIRASWLKKMVAEKGQKSKKQVACEEWPTNSDAGFQTLLKFWTVFEYVFAVRFCL